MRRTVSSTVILAMLATAAPVFGAQAQGGVINGTAKTSDGRDVANTTVRLRDVSTGQLAGTTMSNSGGAFSFTGLSAGNYVVEIVNAAGEIIGTSAAIPVAAGATVTIALTAAAAAAIAGAAHMSTALIIATVAAGAGVTGVVIAKKKDKEKDKDVSPSK